MPRTMDDLVDRQTQQLDLEANASDKQVQGIALGMAAVYALPMKAARATPLP